MVAARRCTNPVTSAAARRAQVDWPVAETLFEKLADEGQVIGLCRGTQSPLLLQVETKLILPAFCRCHGWRYWSRNHALAHQQIQQPLQSG